LLRYFSLSDYSDEIDALDNKAFDKEYSVLMGVRYYVWSVGFMNTNDSDNYNLINAIRSSAITTAGIANA